MNKKVLIVIVVLLLLLGGWYFLVGKKTAMAPTTQIPGGNQQQGSAGSLKDLITRGIAQTCTFSDQASSGTVYVSGGKVRGDFDSTTNGTTTKAHMIVMNNTSYIWTDGQTTGFKMSFDPNATPLPTTAGSTAPKGGLDANANMNYNCSPWSVEASKFTLPTGVTFSTFTMPVAPATTGTSSGSSSSQCSYCDSLTGDSKAQCLTALKCN